METLTINSFIRKADNYPLYIILILFFYISIPNSHSQGLTNQSDLKSLKKAESENKSAITYNNEFKSISEKISQLNDKENQSALEKLKQKQNEAKIKSLTHAFKSNEIRKVIYYRLVDEQTSNVSYNYEESKLLDESKALIYIADSIKKTNGYSKITDENLEMLLSAYDYETTGLDNIEFMFNIQKDWTNVSYSNYVIPKKTTSGSSVSYTTESTDSETTDSDTSLLLETHYLLDGAVAIDQKVLDQYDRYLTNLSNENVVLKDQLDGFSFESLNNFWSYYKDLSYSDLSNADTGSIDSINQNLFAENELAEIRERNISKCNYRIEIIQNTTPVSQETLKKIYESNQEIEVVNENETYKYLIGHFDNFEQADNFKNSLNLTDAVVICIEEAKAVAFYQTTETETRTDNEENKVQDVTEASSDISNYNFEENKIIFIVQVAASRTPLSKQVIKKIYSGPLKVYLKEEEGWYKYQISHTFSYEDAKRTLSSVNINGAFIAAYEMNYKYKLWEAIKKTKSPYDVIYRVQIAASKIKLTENKLNKIYSGDYNIEVILEEDMYKYQITVGNNFKKALQVKKECGIKGAFIVPYRNGVKIKLKDAIDITE